MKTIRNLWISAFLILLLQACSNGSGSASTTSGTSGAAMGAVAVSITDAPADGMDHAWITVKDLWFSQSKQSGPDQTGWEKFPLAAPVTLDLLDLSNGAISVPVWDNIELPEGTYEQIRIILAATEAPLAASATDAGLAYNNQVNLTGDAAAYPLRIPGAQKGIRLEGTFEVKKNGKLKLALDFDAGHDIVKIDHDGQTEYILKPNLASFDLDNAGAITGHIDTIASANTATARFVIKAEQLSADGAVHVLRRATFIADPATGRFILYPLVPGSYDIVISGIGYRTAIIRNVPAVQGTTPTASPTEIPPVTLTSAAAPDYPVSATIASPTGAWAKFYQTLPGANEAPYLIRIRHFGPLTGAFAGFPLSAEPIDVGVYDPAAVNLTTVVPVEGAGGFRAVADAVLYEHSDPLPVDPQHADLIFGPLNVKAPATARTVSGSIQIPADKTGVLDRGVVFAVHGGMIVNALRINSEVVSGGSYTLSNLPGGTADQPLPGAFYSIEALGWSSIAPKVKAHAGPMPADLRTDNAAGIDMSMTFLP